MPEYRAYIIGSNGLILRRIDLLCENDEAAQKRAGQFVNGHDVELWQGASKMAVLAHKAERASSPVTGEIETGRMIRKSAK